MTYAADVVCSWCRRWLGRKVGFDEVGVVSHTICEPCRAKHFPEPSDQTPAACGENDSTRFSTEGSTSHDSSGPGAPGEPQDCKTTGDRRLEGPLPPPQPGSQSGDESPLPAPESGDLCSPSLHAPPGAGDSMCYDEGPRTHSPDGFVFITDADAPWNDGIRGGQGRTDEDVRDGVDRLLIFLFSIFAPMAVVLGAILLLRSCIG